MLDLFPWNPRITYIETSKIDRMECIFCGPILRPIIGPRVIQKLSQRGYIWFCWVLPIAPTHVAPKAHCTECPLHRSKFESKIFSQIIIHDFLVFLQLFGAIRFFWKYAHCTEIQFYQKFFPKNENSLLKIEKFVLTFFCRNSVFGGKFFMFFWCFVLTFRWNGLSAQWAFLPLGKEGYCNHVCVSGVC